ncbi:uncharacterized protein LOC126550395 isoform X2 [Aphis gossypii]|uniref:uncharacterized protein LOC126550395 isoform X2 n=1 Tax=Aphis gossypii TaxID=80765 RepID=UPI002158DC27|nr:uncharacterized protein LOC126550395 isoform X2 [Aphis gossypii]
MMDVRDENNYVFNIRLARRIGLYQILDSKTIKYRGKNVYHIFIAFIALYWCVILIVFSVSSVHYWTNNMTISIDYFWKAENTLFIIYKMWIVIYHSNDIWNCLSITWYGFTSSFSFQKRHILDRWRKRSMSFSTLFAFTYFFGLTIFVGLTQIFRNDTTPVKNRDGSVGYYRQNIMNFYIIVSDETYNTYYNTFFFAEALLTVSLATFFLLFDILLVTLCFAICGQMEMIKSDFESVGHKSIRGPRSPIDYTVVEKKRLSNKHELIYNELKTIIVDHQKVMKKYEDFLALFGKPMLFQIFISSSSLILSWCIFITSLYDANLFLATKVTAIKMICQIFSYSFQIFMMCYLFGNLHNQQ